MGVGRQKQEAHGIPRKNAATTFKAFASWVKVQWARLARTDSTCADTSTYLIQKGYVQRARQCWHFAASSFLYSVFGAYLMLSAEAMDQKFPDFAGLWWWEGFFLVVQGPISYWNDVHSFGLDWTASTVDRASAMTMFMVQCSHWLFLPIEYPTNWVLFSMLWGAGFVFLTAATHFGECLAASGRLGGLPEVSNTSVSPKMSNRASSVTDRRQRRSSRRQGQNAKAKRTTATRNRTPVRRGGGSDLSERGQVLTGSRSSARGLGVSSGEAPPATLRKADAGEAGLLMEKVERHFQHYLFWHTLWHVVLPVPGLVILAVFRSQAGLPLLPFDVLRRFFS
ncbi:unnamed protein product [Amoebophrya sp. A120]|nr:unnamed protein product [Amoebophrya sp. A120]|eukprot:GSA120T00004117001.1